MAMALTDRSKMVVRVQRLSEQDDAGDMRSTTPQERWEMMWRLAQDAWAFKGEIVAEPGLHRHIVRLFRRAG